MEPWETPETCTLREYASRRRYVVLTLVKKHPTKNGRVLTERHLIIRGDNERVEEAGLFDMNGEIIWEDENDGRDTWRCESDELDWLADSSITATSDLDLWLVRDIGKPRVDELFRSEEKDWPTPPDDDANASC